MSAQAGPEPVDHEQVLVARAVAGDREAFDDLCRAYRTRVLRLCRALLSHGEDAEEVTQEAFARAWLKLHTYRPEKARSFGGWISAIARNLCIRYRQQRENRYANVEPSADPDSIGIGQRGAGPELLTPDHPAVREIQALPEKWRTAFHLMLEGCSYDEIGRRMGVSTTNVGVILNRAHGRLQDRLTPLLDRRADPGPAGDGAANRERAWHDLEVRIRGMVVDFRLVTVPAGQGGATLQLWIPVLDLSRNLRHARELRALQRRVQSRPDDWSAWRELAERYQAAGDLEEACAAYRCITSGRPDALAAWVGLGLCEWALQRRPEAEAALRHAVELARGRAERSALEGHLCAVRGENEALTIHRFAKLAGA